jgi:hypothetical protein
MSAGDESTATTHNKPFVRRCLWDGFQIKTHLPGMGLKLFFGDPFCALLAEMR